MIVENEVDAKRAVEDVKAAGVNALVVFLGNFGPETPETLLCQKTAHQEGYAALPAALQQVLDFVRRLIPCDVLNEPCLLYTSRCV